MFRALYPLKPAPAIVRDDRPELGVFGGELEVTPMHCAAVSVPRRQLDVVPTIQNPGLHVGWHDDWLDRLELHVPSVPPVGAETSQALSEHTALFVSTPPAPQVRDPLRV
jgi:hypothetical protein